jgi:uncharacterized protein (UPF0276 family)
MKFALNISQPAIELLHAGRIEMDLFKTPDWPHLIDMASAHRPVYAHFALMAGWGEPVDFDHIDHILSITQTPYINAHIAPNGYKLDVPLTSQDPAHRRLLVEKMLADIQPLTDRYGTDKIVLENAIWDPSEKYGIPALVLDPEIISFIVGETGCGLLLDTAHAVASARFLGIDEHDYLSRLPVDHLRELHVTGLSRDTEGTWIDHYPLGPSDWHIVEWVMDRVRAGMWASPWVMACEYGGVGPAFEERTDSRVIEEQIPRLYDLAQRVWV